MFFFEWLNSVFRYFWSPKTAHYQVIVEVALADLFFEACDRALQASAVFLWGIVATFVPRNPKRA